MRTGHTLEGSHLAEVSRRFTPEELGTLIDLLSHDMLNSNQATLSYLDLIHSYPDMDQRTKDLAERAASQVKSSSMLLDGIRSLVSDPRGGVPGGREAGLKDVLTQVGEEMSDMFPHKRITVDTSQMDPESRVCGAQSLHDLFGNLLLNMVQLHTGEDVAIEVRTSHGADGATITEVIARKATLPHGLDDYVLSGTRGIDVSKMSRISGVVFAGSIARALGGGLRARVFDPEEGRGCAFEVSLGGVCRE